jgi:hypothetical protein
MTTKENNENLNLTDIPEIDRIVHEPARFLIMAYLSVVESSDFLFLMNQTGLLCENQKKIYSKNTKNRTQFNKKRQRSIQQLSKKYARYIGNLAGIKHMGQAVN